jgi:hypothetical protein
MTPSDLFGWTVMAIGTVAGIAFLDFILDNLPDALDQDGRDIADGDIAEIPPLQAPRADH